MKITKSAIKLFANPKAVILQFLQLPGNDRVTNIIERVAKLDEKGTAVLVEKLMSEFGNRHRDIKKIFNEHFERINAQHKNLPGSFSSEKKILLGAFFAKEYSIQSAALFNPSIVSHPDQQNLQAGEQRFVMSLRATGEGHISSIAFQTGVINPNGEIKLDNPSSYFTSLKKNESALYNKEFLRRFKIADVESETLLLNFLPETFTADKAIDILSKEALNNKLARHSLEKIKEFFDSNYELKPSSHMPLNERLIFPAAKSESMGMEDVRFVQFKNDGNAIYYGSYTAYDGKQIKSQLIETDDFNVFKIRTMYGAAISDKGMALLPEKVNGKYVMISRQGGEKINIMFSDNLYQWDEYKTLLEPEYDWELVQLGNCGSPVKTERGWLLLTHGVGVVRTYVISAILLDLNDPAKIIARLDKPLLYADETEREGYVPNVVYTCGLLKHEDLLLIPYALSDSSIGFATMSLNELLNEMKIV